MPGIRYRRAVIASAGRAGGMLRAACDDGTVGAGPGATTLRAGLPDRAALGGFVRQVMGLGPGVVDLHLVTAGSW